MRNTSLHLGHGLPNKRRNQEPSMFQILSWKEEREQSKNKQNLRQIVSNESMNNPNDHFNDRENCNLNLQNKTKQLKFSQHSHQPKNQLYYYNDEADKNKKIIQQASKNILKQFISPNLKKVKNSEKSKSKNLNPNNQNDRFQIQERKKKINRFKMLSRELPDSAFTTYFGKPAFSNYGCGSTSAQKKSFNIMPHAGQNHPQYQQSYETALVKGKQIKQNHVPKKPLQIFVPTQQNMEQSDYYMIPIKKPNLINTMRFSQDKTHLQRKARTPKHNELNFVPSREALHNNISLKNSQHSDRKKLKKVTSMKSFQNRKNDHPLVDNRDHLGDILSQRKRQQNRLAYKVTQCYPLPYENCDKACETKASRWNELRPAGIVSPRSDHVNDVMFTNNIWN